MFFWRYFVETNSAPHNKSNHLLQELNGFVCAHCVANIIVYISAIEFIALFLRFPKAKLLPGIRAFRDGKLMQFKLLAASKAYWNVDPTELAPFADLWHIDLSDCENDFQILFAMVKGALKCTDRTTIDILSQRLAACDLNEAYMKTVMEVDEAIALFDNMDLQEVHAEQKKAATRLEHKDDFAKAYKERAFIIRQACKEKVMLMEKKKYDTQISQAEAKTMIPPDTSIWRGLTRQEWCGHCPPRKRIQASWAEHTESGAMHDVIKRLWIQWLELRGLGSEFCPYEGLLQ